MDIKRGLLNCLGQRGEVKRGKEEEEKKEKIKEKGEKEKIEKEGRKREKGEIIRYHQLLKFVENKSTNVNHA